MGGLTNKDKFILLISAFVQTHAGRNWPGFQDLGAVSILAAAMRIPDFAIPEDYVKAAGQFTNHVTHLRYDDMLKPSWLPDGIIDYRPFRHKSEWESLGIDADAED